MEQLEELRRHLEKERDAKCEEATKELNRVKHEVESRRHDLEVRQKNVEALVAEVSFHVSFFSTLSGFHIEN